MTAPQNPYPPAQPGYGYAPSPPQKKRKVWPWVLLAVILIPVLLFVACSALLGKAVTDVAEQGKGGTTTFGQTFTYPDNLAVNVSAPVAYKPENQFELGPGEAAVAVTFNVTNGTKDSISMALFSANATFNGAPASQVPGADLFPVQDIAPGQSIKVTQAFKVPPKAKGPFQLSVKHGFKDPVFFNGQL